MLQTSIRKTMRLSEQPVITRYRDTNANLRTQLLRIIAQGEADTVAQALPELAGEPGDGTGGGASGHVAAEWMGHSTKVADKHYWRVTDGGLRP